MLSLNNLATVSLGNSDIQAQIHLTIYLVTLSPQSTAI